MAQGTGDHMAFGVHVKAKLARDTKSLPGAKPLGPAASGT